MCEQSRRERRLVVAVTGASGSVYAVRFLQAVREHYDRVLVAISENAWSVIASELSVSLPVPSASQLLGCPCDNIELISPYDLMSPPASGSFQTDGMVIIPCSMGTAGRIAAGISNDLVTRAADVCLKERRRLILVVRETPLSLIHLRNLTALAEAGATVLPAAPGFYDHPQSIDDLVAFVVGRVMQQLGICQTFVNEWGDHGNGGI